MKFKPGNSSGTMDECLNGMILKAGNVPESRPDASEVDHDPRRNDCRLLAPFELLFN